MSDNFEYGEREEGHVPLSLSEARRLLLQRRGRAVLVPFPPQHASPEAPSLLRCRTLEVAVAVFGCSLDVLCFLGSALFGFVVE